MNPPILVDSNIFIDLLREHRDPAAEIPRVVAMLDLVTCGMVRVEVLRGIKAPKARQRMRAYFDVLQYVPTDNRLWEEASDLGWAMERRGWKIPAADIVIAACAQRAGARVMTRDKHFAQIPGITVVPWPED